ncbi:MAG: MerC domain-containing protein [Acidobacteria bacterium]|nr:MAG: MerC domain-containing protein [Acidobacteriota bacterium]
MPWKDHLDKVGIVGSFVAAACCLGLPAIVSIIAAVGLGFLIKDAILLPLMIVFLAVTLIGLFLGYRVHRQPWALLLGGISSIATFFFIFVHTVKLAAYIAIVGLVLAGVLNVLLSRKSAPTLSR